jgi:quinol monooxygenase YgiN
MVIEYVRYKVDSSHEVEFISAYSNAAQQLDASEYCLAYELSECEEEPGVFILRIEWTSTEDHLNGFRKSAVFPPFFAEVKPFFNNILEMRHYKVNQVYKRKM